MFTRDYRRLVALRTVGEGGRVRQRSLARRLGISLGLANAVLHELESEGLLAMSEVGHARLLRYELTARGRRALKGAWHTMAAEAGELLEGVRAELAERARGLKADGCGRVLLCGEGALADVAACALMSAGLKLAGVVSREGVGGRVAGRRVRGMEEAKGVRCDVAVGLWRSDAAALRRRVAKGVRVVGLLSGPGKGGGGGG